MPDVYLLDALRFCPSQKGLRILVLSAEFVPYDCNLYFFFMFQAANTVQSYIDSGQGRSSAFIVRGFIWYRPRLGRIISMRMSHHRSVVEKGVLDEFGKVRDQLKLPDEGVLNTTLYNLKVAKLKNAVRR